MAPIRRSFIADLPSAVGQTVVIRGWIYRLRILAKTTFIIVKDCSGESQCVADPAALGDLRLKLDDAVEIRGRVRSDERAWNGLEIDVESASVLNRSANVLPF